jgi:hypothetical protein
VPSLGSGNNSTEFESFDFTYTMRKLSDRGKIIVGIICSRRGDPHLYREGVSGGGNAATVNVV